MEPVINEIEQVETTEPKVETFQARNSPRHIWIILGVLLSIATILLVFMVWKICELLIGAHSSGRSFSFLFWVAL